MSSEATQIRGAAPHHRTEMVGQEAPPGFRRTEAGAIPVDWDVDRIDAHALIKTGGRNTQDRVEDGRYPFFVRSQQVESINSYSYDGEAVLTAGDGVGTGKVYHYIKGRFDVHQRVYRISDFSDRLNGRYFFYQFSTRFYDRIMSMTAKSSVDSVRMEMIAGMQIPLPKPAEQRAIAEALSDVDGLLGALEALIAKKRAIKQAAMQQLLTGKTRLPGFSGEWETAQLPQVTTIRKGELITASTLTPGPVPVIAGGITPAYFHSRANRSHPCVTVSASGANAGYVAYHRSPIFASDCSTVEGASRVSTEFVYHWLASNQHHVYGLQSGGAQPHVQPKDLARLSISFPMLDEQRAIIAVLSDMEAKIAALEVRRDKTGAIKQGMMQQLLTGRVRLVKPEAAA